MRFGAIAEITCGFRRAKSFNGLQDLNQSSIHFPTVESIGWDDSGISAILLVDLLLCLPNR